MATPIFLNNGRVSDVFLEIKKATPEDSELFLVGGTLRNAVFYHFFKKKIKQRDYDLIFMGDKNKLLKNLKSIGFREGDIKREKQIVLKKKIAKKPKDLSDFVVLDISFFKNENIKNILRSKINFTINGFALNIKDVFDKKWMKKMVKLPHSLDDIKRKQIRLNTEKGVFFGTDLYACMRFISQGFKKPSDEEIKKLLKSSENISKDVFEMNMKKLFDYVGGKEKAKEIAEKMGLKKNIFKNI